MIEYKVKKYEVVIRLIWLWQLKDAGIHYILGTKHMLNSKHLN